MRSDDGIDLRTAARRATASKRFIAGLFPAWQRAFDQRPEDFLRTGEANLASLALCLRPGDGRWTEDVSDLAAACGIEPDLLATFLRQALSVETLATAPDVGMTVDGRLLAARDRSDDEK